MSLSLISLDGLQQGERLPISALPASLGRAGDNDVVVVAEGVAPAHARLTLSGNGLYLEDLTGGTVRINGSSNLGVRLQSGDILELGQTRLLVQLTLPKTDDITPGQRAGAQPAAAPSGVWVAGFSESLREWAKDELAAKIMSPAETFRTGEEVLIQLSRSLSQAQAPALIILDLRLPIVNGINVGIAVRAFELGFRRVDRIPLVFIFEPPDSSSFDKIVKFCQPLKVYPLRGTDEVVKKLILQAVTENQSRSEPDGA